MVNQLLLPGHVEQIAGFAGFRAAVESLVGPLSTQALASQIFGLYSGFVYFTPLLGGMIADRWIGQRNGVVIGALSMSAGHIAMSFRQSFLVALLLLVVGSGFLKGNISAQVGALYPPRGRGAADPRVHHLQHGNQCRSGRRTACFAVCSRRSTAGTMASASPRSSCSLALRPISTDTGTCRRGWSGASSRALDSPRRAAHRLRAHAVMVITIFQSSRFPNLQRRTDLDSTACRAGRWRLPDPGPLVPIDQFGFQHPGRAAGILDMASAGIATSRAGRTRKDRHGSLDRRSEQSDPGGRNLRSGGAPVHPIWPLLLALDWESPSSTTGPRFSHWFHGLRRPR